MHSTPLSAFYIPLKGENNVTDCINSTSLETKASAEMKNPQQRLAPVGVIALVDRRKGVGVVQPAKLSVKSWLMAAMPSSLR